MCATPDLHTKKSPHVLFPLPIGQKGNNPQTNPKICLGWRRVFSHLHTTTVDWKKFTIYKLRVKTTYQITLGDSSKKARWESRIYSSFLWQKTKLEHNRIIINKRKPDMSSLWNLALFYVGEDARGWVHWNHSCVMHVSCLGPAPSLLILSFLRYTIGQLQGLTAHRPASWVPSGLTIRAVA